MPTISLDITGPSYDIPFSPATSNQQSINMFPIPSGPSNPAQSENTLYAGRGKATLTPTAGFYEIADVADTHTPDYYTFASGLVFNMKCKALMQTSISDSGATYIGIWGRSVYIIYLPIPFLQGINTPIITYTYSLDNVPDNNPKQAMSFNTTSGVTTVLIAHGGALYYVRYSGLNTFTGGAKLSPSLSSINGLAQIDGYSFRADFSSDQFYSSSINNGLTWNSADTARMQSSPDQLVTFGQTKGELWGFGQKSIEVWYDAGNASPGMPFSKRVGSDLGVGIMSSSSLSIVNEKLFWLDSRGFVASSDFSTFFRDQSSGYQVNKVSDDAIDAAIDTYIYKYGAISSTYVDRGHVMYELTFPSVIYPPSPPIPEKYHFHGKTFVLDTNTNMWHEKQYYDPVTGLQRGESYLNFYESYKGTTLAASMRDTKLYILDSSIYTDNTAPVYRYRRTKIYNNMFKQITVNSLEIKCLTGQITSGSPVIDMRYSHDSGYTWSSWLSRSLGTAGQYGQRITWNLLGTSQEWEFEFRVVEDCNFSIVDAAANITLENI